jgi:hypothetical protein
MQCPPIKSPPLIWYWFFPKRNISYAFVVKQNAKKHIFKMEFHPKVLNFLINVYQYHAP